MLNENVKCQACVKCPSPVGTAAELREVAPPQPQPPKSNPPLMKNLSNITQTSALQYKDMKKNSSLYESEFDFRNFSKENLISENFQMKICRKDFAPLLSKHLKGQLGPRVCHVTFLDQRRSVGAPRLSRHVFGSKKGSWGPASVT